MAVLTAQGISSIAIELLTRSLVLPATVTRIPGGEFTGPNGSTITVRVPQPGSALIQATPGTALTPADVNEIPVDVTLEHIYHLKNVTDQEMTYDLENFARQVTRVQTSAVATKAEDQLAGAMNDLAADATIQFALNATPEDTKAVILQARQFLGDNNAPAGDRFFAVSPDIATRVLSVPDFTRVDASGSDSSLRQAVIGRLYGFTFVESNALTAGTAVAYHRSGFVFANRVPVRPRGATDSATATADGVGLRHVFQYDASTASDQSLVSTFAGAAAVWDDAAGTDNQRFIKIGTSAT